MAYETSSYSKPAEISSNDWTQFDRMDAEANTPQTFSQVLPSQEFGELEYWKLKGYGKPSSLDKPFSNLPILHVPLRTVPPTILDDYSLYGKSARAGIYREELSTEYR